MASYLKDFLTNIGAATTIGGPAFAGWHYIKTRTYAVKLELSVDGEILYADNETFLRIRAAIKNIGNSRVALKGINSYIRVCTVESTNPHAAFLEPSYLMSLAVLSPATSLEAGETASDDQLANIGHGDYLALHVEFGVTSKGLFSFLRGRDWTKTAIINCQLKPEAPHSV